MYGHILNELQEVIERPEETDHVLRLGLHRLAITEFPLLRALAPALASYDGAAELDRVLDLLLPGLTATLTGPRPSPTKSETTYRFSRRTSCVSPCFARCLKTMWRKSPCANLLLRDPSSCLGGGLNFAQSFCALVRWRYIRAN